jgi:hypothetical protein
MRQEKYLPKQISESCTKNDQVMLAKEQNKSKWARIESMFLKS